jgi:hypothetical protein
MGNRKQPASCGRPQREPPLFVIAVTCVEHRHRKRVAQDGRCLGEAHATFLGVGLRLERVSADIDFLVAHALNDVRWLRRAGLFATHTVYRQARGARAFLSGSVAEKNCGTSPILRHRQQPHRPGRFQRQFMLGTNCSILSQAVAPARQARNRDAVAPATAPDSAHCWASPRPVAAIARGCAAAAPCRLSSRG